MLSATFTFDIRSFRGICNLRHLSLPAEYTIRSTSSTQSSFDKLVYTKPHFSGLVVVYKCGLVAVYRIPQAGKMRLGEKYTKPRFSGRVREVTCTVPPTGTNVLSI